MGFSVWETRAICAVARPLCSLVVATHSTSRPMYGTPAAKRMCQGVAVLFLLQTRTCGIPYPRFAPLARHFTMDTRRRSARYGGCGPLHEGWGRGGKGSSYRAEVRPSWGRGPSCCESGDGGHRGAQQQPDSGRVKMGTNLRSGTAEGKAGQRRWNLSARWAGGPRFPPPATAT